MVGLDIRPIKTAADDHVVPQEISALIASDPALGPPDGDRLDVLVTLMPAYAAKYFAIGPPDAVETIKLRSEQPGLAPRDLELTIGSPGRVSWGLSGKRRLSLALLWRLHQGLGIAAGTSIRPPRGA